MSEGLLGVYAQFYTNPAESEGERLQEIGLLIIDRLEGLKKRFSTRKLDIDMDRLVKDVRGLLT